MKLRRASLARLIQEWAATRHLPVTAIPVTGLPSEFEAEPNFRLMVFSVGGASLDDAETQACLRELVALMPTAPLVVVSDLERPNEVATAFTAGARAFLPTSIEPKLALQVLAFVLDGGSFFPPHLLLNHRTETSNESGGDQKPLDRAHEAESCSSRLTSRQQQVAHLLRRGMSNKLIARELMMTEATVKVHVRQIMRKLGATNRTQAALCAIDPAHIRQQATNGGASSTAVQHDLVAVRN
jgi:DNA-binding NarL/FixJ family response regulator